MEDSKSTTKLYIRGLNIDVTQDDIGNNFQKFGQITSINLKKKDNFAFAFLEFTDPASAQQALNSMNGNQFMGNRLRVQYAKDNRSSKSQRNQSQQPQQRKFFKKQFQQKQEGMINNRRENRDRSRQGDPNRMGEPNRMMNGPDRMMGPDRMIEPFRRNNRIGQRFQENFRGICNGSCFCCERRMSYYSDQAYRNSFERPPPFYREDRSFDGFERRSPYIYGGYQNRNSQCRYQQGPPPSYYQRQFFEGDFRDNYRGDFRGDFRSDFRGDYRDINQRRDFQRNDRFNNNMNSQRFNNNNRFDDGFNNQPLRRQNRNDNFNNQRNSQNDYQMKNNFNSNTDNQDQRGGFQSGRGNFRGNGKGGNSNTNGDKNGGRDQQNGGQRSCFNCGQGGHFAKQCPKQRKGRSDFRGRGRGGYSRGSQRNQNENENNRKGSEQQGQINPIKQANAGQQIEY